MKIFKDSMKLSADFPFEISSETLKSEDNCKNSYHWHDFYEISYVVKGSGSYFLNGEMFDVDSGDILIFSRAKLHGWIVSEGSMELVVIVFSPVLLAFSESETEEWENSIRHKLDGSLGQTKQLVMSIEKLKSEYADKKSGYHLAVKAELLRLLTDIIRFQDSSALKEDKDLNKNQAQTDNRDRSLTESEKVSSMERMEAVTNYVNQHYTEKIALEEVAAEAHMNANYFSGYFKRLTGLTFQEYLISYRMDKAEELKQESGMSTTEAARRCGFHNISNYYRLYKKYMQQNT